MSVLLRELTILNISIDSVERLLCNSCDTIPGKCIEKQVNKNLRG